MGGCLVSLLVLFPLWNGTKVRNTAYSQCFNCWVYNFYFLLLCVLIMILKSVPLHPGSHPSLGCGRPSGSHLSPPPRPPSSSVSFQSPYTAPQGRRALDAHWRTGQTESLRRPVRTPGGWGAGSSGASLRLELLALRRQRSGLCFHSEGTPIPPH